MAKCQNIFKWFIDVPWPPLIPLPSGRSLGGSPFGRSLVPNRDAAYLHEVLWPGRDGVLAPGGRNPALDVVDEPRAEMKAE